MKQDLFGLSKKTSFAAHSETGYIFMVCEHSVSRLGKNIIKHW